MRVKIELLAPFSGMTDEHRFNLEFSGKPTMRSVISRLEQKIGKRFTDRLLSVDMQIRPGITILKNGINLTDNNFMDSTIDDNTSLVFCIAVSGG